MRMAGAEGIALMLRDFSRGAVKNAIRFRAIPFHTLLWKGTRDVV